MANVDDKVEDPKPTTDGETKVETKTNADEAQEPVKLTKDVEERILRQVEYYFGDINLPKDKFLLEQIGLDDGWVPMTVLMSFKRLAALCPKSESIVQVILDSNTELIEVNDDRTKIRRNPDMPIPEYNDERRKELGTRTAYAKGFDKDETLESLMKFFEPHGQVESVIMRCYNDRLTKKRVFKGSVYAIFKDVDTCKKFIELETVKYNDTDLIRKWQAVYLEEKKNEHLERNQKKGKYKPEPETKAIKFPKGAVVHMSGFSDATTREMIKKQVSEVFGSEPAYITYEKGNEQGYVRFNEENDAVEFMKKLTDSKLKIDENDIEVRLLEGEEEDKFLTDVSEAISKSRQFGKGKNRKRKGGQNGAHKSKRPRK